MSATRWSVLPWMTVAALTSAGCVVASLPTVQWSTLWTLVHPSELIVATWCLCEFDSATLRGYFFIWRN